MSASRIITLGFSQFGHGKYLPTVGLSPQNTETVIVVDGITSTVVDGAAVSLLEALSGWTTPAADGTTVRLHSTLGVGVLGTGMPYEVLKQVQQRRTGYGMKNEDYVRVRWSSDSPGGFDEMVFTWTL